ncbi:hypothetical protein GF407_16045 [candidate division KSB1 bacterium]|nr:hypothetical protein [candidate division KSB1 bacterium]
MNYNEIDFKLFEDHPYWQALKVSEDKKYDHPEKIPRIISVCSGLIYNALQREDMNKLGLLFPKRFTLAYWISFCLSLPIFKKYHLIDRALEYKYNKKDIVLYNNKYIVQIADKNEKYYKIWAPNNVWSHNRPIMSNDGGTINVNRDDRIYIQPVQTEKNFSLLEKVYKDKGTNNKDIFDELLNIKCCGNALCNNSTIVLITSKNKTIPCLKSSYLSAKNNLINLVVCGDLIAPALFQDFSSVKKTNAHPLLVIASSLYTARNYMDEHISQIKLVVFDGTKCIERDKGSFEHILDLELPVVTIMDPMDDNYIYYLESQGFYISQIPEKFLDNNLKDTNHSAFNEMNFSFRAHFKKEYNVLDCRFSELSDTFDQFQQLKRLIKSNHARDEMDELLSKLGTLLKSFSWLTYYPDTLFNDFVNNVLSETKQIAKKIELEIPQEINKKIQVIEKSINDLFEKMATDEKSKIRWMSNLLNKVKSKKIAIITRYERDIEKTKKYWSSLLKQNQVYIYSYRNYAKLEQKQEFFDQVWITGFWSFEKLKKWSFLAPTNQIFFFWYPHEKRMARKFLQWWENVYKVSTNHNFDYLYKLYNNPKTTDRPQAQSIAKPIIKQKRKISKNNMDSYIINFANGYYMVLSRNHSLYIVNDYFSQGENGKIIEREFDDLKVGDFVLYRNTQTDIVREWVDKELEIEGKKKLRILSEAWKEPLQNYVYQELDHHNNLREIHRAMIRKGFKLKYETFIRWLYDRNVIAPGKKETLEFILNLAESDLLQKIDQMYKAIRTIRQRHRRAYLKINKLLSEKLPAYLQNSSIGKEYYGPFNIDKVGEIRILKILKIEEEPVHYDDSYCDRFLTHEQLAKHFETREQNQLLRSLLQKEGELLNMLVKLNQLFSK